MSSMYIRSQEEALDALAEILEIPERCLQIVQSSVKIMMCLDPIPRAFLADCQSFLIEGGLEALRRKRRETMEAKDVLVVLCDPEEDWAFEMMGSAMDALRVADMAMGVFPEMSPKWAPWEVARAVLADDAAIQKILSDGVRFRGQDVPYAEAVRALESSVAAHLPAWRACAPLLREVCGRVLAETGVVKDGRVEEQAGLLFGVVAVADERAQPLVDAMEHDLPGVMRKVFETYELMEAVRSMHAKAPGNAPRRPPPSGAPERGVREDSKAGAP